MAAAAAANGGRSRTLHRRQRARPGPAASASHGGERGDTGSVSGVGRGTPGGGSRYGKRGIRGGFGTGGGSRCFSPRYQASVSLRTEEGPVPRARPAAPAQGEAVPAGDEGEGGENGGGNSGGGGCQGGWGSDWGGPGGGTVGAEVWGGSGGGDWGGATPPHGVSSPPSRQPRAKSQRLRWHLKLSGQREEAAAARAARLDLLLPEEPG